MTRTKRLTILLFCILGLLELFHVNIMFNGAELLAGGDNYTYLQLYKSEIKTYIWDSSFIPFGGVAFYLPYVFSVPLYSKLLGFLPYPVIQRVLLFVFFMLRHVALIKLAKYLAKKFSPIAIFPILILYSYNVFESLNPFSLFSLMYGIYLPFSLYYFLRVFDSTKVNITDVSKLVLLSVVFSPINANIALSGTIFIPQFLYILLNIKKLNVTKLANLAIYAIFFLLANFWWLFVLATYYLQSAENVIKGGWFSATSVGELSQNFRFIGQWGWYGSHFLKAYYPFNNYYDNPLVVIATFIPAIAAFYIGLNKSETAVLNKLRIFLVCSALIGLFFVGGTRPPLGFVYQFLYDHLFILRIFREPFTKFSEIYILSVCLLCYMFLLKLEERLNTNKYIIAILVALGIVLIITKPVLLGQHVWNSWNGSMRTLQINIPDYWKEFEAYTSSTLSNARILTTPRPYYGAGWNWQNGFTSADDVAVNFLHNGNGTIRELINNGSISGSLIGNIFSKEGITKKYLSLLGITHVLQENDLDWRYSGESLLSPTQNTAFLAKFDLEPVQNFGLFDDKYLAKIPNRDPISTTKNQLFYELKDKPILNLFYLGDENILPLFYIPKYTVYSVNDPESLDQSLNAANYTVPTQYFVTRPKKVNTKQISISDEINVIGKRIVPKIDFSSLVWNIAWSWPNASVSPYSKKHLLVLLKEKFSVFSLSDTNEKVENLIWLGAKRSTEISKYELKGEIRQVNINRSITLFKQAIELLDSMYEPKKEQAFWEMHAKLYSYMQKSLALLQDRSTKSNDLDKFFDLYDQYSENLKARTQIVCDSICFTFDIPKDGLYQILNNSNIISERELAGGTVLKFDFREDNPKQTFRIDKITKDNVAQFIRLADWRSKTQYKISFDYKINHSTFDVTFLEDKPDYTDFRLSAAKIDSPVPTLRKILFRQKFDASRICLDDSDPCFSHFERDITSSLDANGGYLYLTLPAEDEFKASVEIINFKVTEYTTPNMFLRYIKKSQNAQNTEASFPHIEFTKINPTRYEVKVRSATGPYNLVFNETFSKYWKIYFENRPISQDNHFVANSYANSWHIAPEDVDNKSDYTLLVDFSLQKYLDYAFYVLYFMIGICVLLIVCAVTCNFIKEKLWKK